MIRKIVFYLLFLLLLGNTLDYLTTYFVLNDYGFNLEKNNLINDNKSLAVIKILSLLHSFSIVFIYFLIERLPEKIRKPIHAINVWSFTIVLLTVWRAVIININNYITLMQ